MQTFGYVRKKDFKVALTLPTVSGETDADRERHATTVIEAIYLVKPSFLCPRLLFEVRQPLIGRIANAVVRMCRFGIPAMQIDTLYPGNLALADDEQTHNIIYRYGDGRIVEQETPMCRDVLDGDEFMTHILVAVFENFRVETHEWAESSVPTLIVSND